MKHYITNCEKYGKVICSYDIFRIFYKDGKYYGEDEDGIREIELVKAVPFPEYEDLSEDEIFDLCDDYNFSGELDDCSAYCFWK